jgi:VWFA-related protein
MNFYRGSLLCIITGVAFGMQNPADAPPATFRTGTKLVQVSVVAQDKKGKPVADLRRDEFQVFDNGTPQDIRLFLMETDKPNLAPPEPKAPNTFTNQIAGPSGSRSGYSVILIDNLLTEFSDDFGGSSVARLKALQTLRSIPRGEKIAIYAFRRKLQIICEFTSDRDLLERQLQVWAISPDAPTANSEILGNGANLGDASEKAREGATAIDMIQRIDAANGELEQVADHLTGVPGRKNLIWLAHRFVIKPKALQKLKDASVAIYPVDVDGVTGGLSGANRVLDGIAAQTGGVAYYNRNDIEVAIREAMDDGRVSYTLGFYPSGDDRPSQIHQLAVKVDRPGIVLRFRTSYQTDGPPPAAVNTKAELLQALNRPIDATALPIIASVKRAQDRLNVNATLDVGSLELTRNQDRWTGKIKVVARFTAADGNLVGEPVVQTLDFKLRPETYTSGLQRGLAYHNDLKIPAKAVELRLLFANPASGKIGTLTIPLSEIEASVTTTK